MAVLPHLPRFQRAVDYFYLNWQRLESSGNRSPVSELHRRLLLYERSPVAAEATGRARKGREPPR